ncbi:LapA family protein [Variovorax robiniae]|uniref:LapA family protein n=1 Tax=Variovorax robiniae TaxID=1836199 RepID=A0ABU8X9V0_9BURK
MGVRSGILILLVVLIAALATLNWGILIQPTLMSIGFMQVTAPFGVIMLGLTSLLGVLFLAYVFYLQSTVMLETRRHTKELQSQRELADKAELSRFTELRSFLEAQELTRVTQANQRQEALLARVQQLEASLRQRVDESDNTTAAHVGQLEDRFRPAIGEVVPQRG